MGHVKKTHGKVINMAPEQKPLLKTSETNRRKIVTQLVLAAVVVMSGAMLAYWLMQTAPKAKPRPQVRNAAMVEVRPVVFGPEATMISIMGTVQPKDEVELQPEVSGKIISINEAFLPGRFFRDGETLLQIDTRDFELAIQQRSSEVAKAAADLQLERGRQKVARKEYELLGEEVSDEEQELMLRVPQLESARAELAVAETRLSQAQLDLERTRIRAPFNSVVITRDVNVGTSVTPSTVLGTLIGTDHYWVKALIPTSQLQWIHPGGHNATGSPAHIFDTAAWGEQRSRIGHTAGLTGKIEEQGRMAEILIDVPDPLGLSPDAGNIPKLLLGSYVRIDIEGKPLESVAMIDRNLVRDGNQVWIMDDNDRLDIRKIEIAFKSPDHVLVQGGIEPGERLITSNLPSPVQGMSLRLSENRQAGSTEDPSKP